MFLLRVLVEVGLHFPLKKVFIIHNNDDHPILVSYKKLFEVCFYCGRRRFDGHECAESEVDNNCFLIEMVFEISVSSILGILG